MDIKDGWMDGWMDGWIHRYPEFLRTITYITRIAQLRESHGPALK